MYYYVVVVIVLYTSISNNEKPTLIVPPFVDVDQSNILGTTHLLIYIFVYDKNIKDIYLINNLMIFEE